LNFVDPKVLKHTTAKMFLAFTLHHQRSVYAYSHAVINSFKNQEVLQQMVKTPTENNFNMIESRDYKKRENSETILKITNILIE